MQTVFEYQGPKYMRDGHPSFERVYSPRTSPSSPIAINMVDSYNVFDYATSTKIMTLLLALYFPESFTVRNVKCGDRLEKMVLVVNTATHLYECHDDIDHMCLTYAGTLARLGIAGFSLVPYKYSGHNGGSSSTRSVILEPPHSL